VAIDPRRLRITLDVEFDVTQSRRNRGQRVKDAAREATEQARRMLEQQLARDGVEPKVQASAEWMYLWDEWDPSD
jgi:hypothetical protein